MGGCRQDETNLIWFNLTCYASGLVIYTFGVGFAPLWKESRPDRYYALVAPCHKSPSRHSPIAACNVVPVSVPGHQDAGE